jgi:hypothetical protein
LGSHQVVILGDGVAASALTIGLLATDIRPVMLRRRLPEIAMAEALPVAAMSLLEALDLKASVARSALVTRGLDNRWRSARLVQRDYPFIVVDRTQFARELRDEAIRRGAQILDITKPPRLVEDKCGVSVTMSSETAFFNVAVDASGRAAAWSQPLVRLRHLCADIFAGPNEKQTEGLALVRNGEGWAYRLSFGDRATIGVLSPSRRRSSEMPGNVAESLGISPHSFRWIGRRVAFPQWSMRPIRENKLAVGDAALAHDPLSGQGVRFALSSALAARAVIRTILHRPSLRDWAERFYEEFVTTERARHGAVLQSLYGSDFNFSATGGSAHSLGEKNSPSLRGDETLHFSARIESAPMLVDGFIERGDVVRLSDGGSVRWLGGFDLLSLRNMTQPRVSVPRLIERMGAAGISSHRAQRIIRWCYQARILASSQIVS